MVRTLKVGVVGASPDRGWARISHVPAIQAVEGLELHAVATRDQASADRAARQYGAARGYASGDELIADPEVGLVVVAVNVPAHGALLRAALAAGKPVLCEFPLGRDAADSEALAASRDAAALARGFAGLQARLSPAVVLARRLLEEAAIGRILSARVLSTTAAFGPEVEAALAFAEDGANGVTLAGVQGAHTLDLVELLLGTLDGGRLLASTQFATVEIEGRGPHRRTTADHLLITGRTAEGAPVSLEVAGGRPPDRTPFHMELTGEAGVLRLEGGAARGFQSGALTLRLNGEVQPTPPPPASDPQTAANVSALYAAVLDDLRDGGDRAPGFAQAVRAQRRMQALLDAT